MESQTPSGIGETFPSQSIDFENDRREWLRNQTAMAWGQYSHEESMHNTRSTVFTTIQAGLLALLGGISGPLINLNRYNIASYEFDPGLLALGFFMVVFALVSFPLLWNWDRLTKSAKAYVFLRWACARKYEELGRMHGIGLTEIEDRWQAFQVVQPRARYFPFPDSDSLKSVFIEPKAAISWWSLIKVLIYTYLFVWLIVLVIGVFLLVVGLRSITAI